MARDSARRMRRFSRVEGGRRGEVQPAVDKVKCEFSAKVPAAFVRVGEGGVDRTRSARRPRSRKPSNVIASVVVGSSRKSAWSWAMASSVRKTSESSPAGTIGGSGETGGDFAGPRSRVLQTLPGTPGNRSSSSSILASYSAPVEAEARVGSWRWRFGERRRHRGQTGLTRAPRLWPCRTLDRRRVGDAGVEHVQQCELEAVFDLRDFLEGWRSSSSCPSAIRSLTTRGVGS